MVWSSFTDHSSFVCCSLLDHWLCPYVHSSTIQTPLLGHKTKGIFSVLLWLGPLVQPVRNGPNLNLSVSSFGVFVENKKRLSWYTSFWDGLVDVIIVCSCPIVWIRNQLFNYWSGDGWKGVFIDIVFVLWLIDFFGSQMSICRNTFSCAIQRLRDWVESQEFRTNYMISDSR